jgi:hypothetical protein
MWPLRFPGFGTVRPIGTGGQKHSERKYFEHPALCKSRLKNISFAL